MKKPGSRGQFFEQSMIARFVSQNKHVRQADMMRHVRFAEHGRGQFFSMDMIIAVSAFLVCLLMIIALWAALTSALGERATRRELQDSAMVAASQLVLTSGNPANWSIGNFTRANSLGVVRERNMLNEQKVAKLQALNSTNYTDIKENLGCGRNELYVTVSNIYSNETLYRFGKSAPAGLEDFTTNHIVTRIALLNDTEVLLRVETWNIRQ